LLISLVLENLVLVCLVSTFIYFKQTGIIRDKNILFETATFKPE